MQSVATSAFALLRWIAALPDDVRDGIEPLPAFRDDIERAWQEPVADSWVSLCNTVQDVWAHACGPEACDDTAVMAELMRERPSAVLDFGAGAGHFAIALARQDVEVDAVEIDAVKTSFLAWRVVDAGLGTRVHLGQRRTTYEAVLAIDVLDHLQDPAAALRALVGRVTPGGRLHLLARFPQDGWHQGDPEVVRRCADELHATLRLRWPAQRAIGWLDTYVRDQATRDEGFVRPCLHPRAEFRRNPDGEGWWLGASAFDTGHCLVDDETRAFCETLDGRSTLEQLSRHSGIAADEIDELCATLRSQRLLLQAQASLEVAVGA
jgi:hypothetical protein